MFSALANHSSVAKRILAELALEERFSRFVFVLVMLLLCTYKLALLPTIHLNEQIPMWIYSREFISISNSVVGSRRRSSVVDRNKKYGEVRGMRQENKDTATSPEHHMLSQRR